MTLKISDPQAQKAVLNRWADGVEADIRTLKQGTARTTSVASGAAASSSSSSSPVIISNFKTIVSNYTIQKTDSYLLVNSSGAVTITLQATPAQAGQLWRIKNINTGLVTLTTQNGSSVENLAFVTLPLQMQSFDIFYDGSKFWIF